MPDRQLVTPMQLTLRIEGDKIFTDAKLSECNGALGGPTTPAQEYPSPGVRGLHFFCTMAGTRGYISGRLPEATGHTFSFSSSSNCVCFGSSAKFSGRAGGCSKNLPPDEKRTRRC